MDYCTFILTIIFEAAAAQCGRPGAPQFSLFAQAEELQELRATGRTNTNVPAQESKNSQR
jgi:hypothetical protein